MRELAIAVLLQALKDLRDSDILKALDAALWLSGSDAPFWFDGLGMGDVDGLTFLTKRRSYNWTRRLLR